MIDVLLDNFLQGVIIIFVYEQISILIDIICNTCLVMIHDDWGIDNNGLKHIRAWLVLTLRIAGFC